MPYSIYDLVKRIKEREKKKQEELDQADAKEKERKELDDLRKKIVTIKFGKDRPKKHIAGHR